MNLIKWTFRALLCIGLIQFVSCTKTIDTVSNDSVSMETSSDLTFPVTNEFSNCKLRRIVHHEYGDDPTSPLVNGLFTYNAAGNPVSLTYGSGTGTGNQNHYFIYDKQGRLKEYRKRYSPDDPVEEERHVYGYDANNRIVTDSVRNTWGGVYIESQLTYDSLGRIIKEVISWKGHPTRYPTYTYDARGNLGVIGWKSSSYDNKVSIFRAHPIFQFIFRNYSRNNAGVQAKYNSKGLPLSARPLNTKFFNTYSTAYGSGYGIVKAMYDCQ